MKKQISSKKKIVLITVSLILVALLAWFGIFLYKYFTDHGERKTYVDPIDGKVFHYYLDENDYPYIYDPRSLGKKTPLIIPHEKAKLVGPRETAKLRESVKEAKEASRVAAERAAAERAAAEKAAAEKAAAEKAAAKKARSHKK